MPANLGYDGRPLIGDLRLRPGSYIRCGEVGHQALYLVLGTHIERPARGAAFMTLTCEDCATPDSVKAGIGTVQLGIEAVRRECSLVRAAPRRVERPPAQGYQAPDGA